MKGFTIQHSIEELEKKVEELEGGGGGGTVTADEVSYDNTSSGLTADDVQEAIDELAIKAITAGSVTYDNTSSGLTADDVQEAIDEIATRKPVIYSTTEHVVGKYGNEDLYEVQVDISALPDTADTPTNYAHGIQNLGKLVSWTGNAYTSAGTCYPIPINKISDTASGATFSIHAYVNTTNIVITTSIDRSSMSGTFSILYTKAASQAKSRKK